MPPSGYYIMMTEEGRVPSPVFRTNTWKFAESLLEALPFELRRDPPRLEIVAVRAVDSWILAERELSDIQSVWIGCKAEWEGQAGVDLATENAYRGGISPPLRVPERVAIAMAICVLADGLKHEDVPQPLDLSPFTPRQREVIEALRGGETLGAQQIAAKITSTETSVRGIVREMREHPPTDLILTIRGPGGYRIAPKYLERLPRDPDRLPTDPLEPVAPM